MPLKVKGQASFFIKVLFVIAISIAFLLSFLQFREFVVTTTKERAISTFKIQVLNILQKLVTDYNCLAYHQNKTPYKIVIDKSKLDDFSVKYVDIEPECAKAVDFDYSIKVVQFEHNFSTYPGEKIVSGEPELTNSLAWHEAEYNSTYVYYGLCNFEPKKQPENCSGELDGPTNCPRDCWYHPEPWNKCPGVGPYGGICCINYICPKDKCEVKNNTLGGHPWVVLCDVNLTEDCVVYQDFLHRWCGKVAIDVPKPVGVTVNISIKERIWDFSLTAGITAFSPEKAKQWEIEMSLPVTIRYNETFSTEGIIYIYAVKGELESLASTLEDVCEKAISNPNQDIIFTKDFHFSFPVNYFSVAPTSSNICMIDHCKKFVCPYTLEAQNITSEGDYLLKFYFNSATKTIRVSK